MPGTKDGKPPHQWFKKTFGFRELPYNETKVKFRFADDILRLHGNNNCFHVGRFDVLSLEQLRARLDCETSGKSLKAGALTFRNIRASTLDLHLDADNAGAVFQVASLFNCLELADPESNPEAGVTWGGNQQTQGGACASACPAATVFRNYFVNSEGQSAHSQLDCLSEVAELLGNRREQYWVVRNGFCLPTRNFGRIRQCFQQKPELTEEIRSKVQVGVHWDTEVLGGTHRVAQVFCSAAAVSLSKQVKANDWAPLARPILDAEFEAVLSVAASLALQRGQRVSVYLTPVGGGMLGNRVQWISSAINRALTLYQDWPLDVHMAHLGFPTLPLYKQLEDGRCPRLLNRSVDSLVKKLGAEVDELELEAYEDEQEFVDESTERARQIAKTFAFFDTNGDGVIDRDEFMDILIMLDEYFFNMDSVDRMLECADADGDGVVHYAEFACWLTGAEMSSVVRGMFTASLAKTTQAEFSTDVAETPEICEMFEPHGHARGHRSSMSHHPSVR